MKVDAETTGVVAVLGAKEFYVLYHVIWWQESRRMFFMQKQKELCAVSLENPANF